MYQRKHPGGRRQRTAAHPGGEPAPIRRLPRSRMYERKLPGGRRQRNAAHPGYETTSSRPGRRLSRLHQRARLPNGRRQLNGARPSRGSVLKFEFIAWSH
ncbi:hypothetical protein CALCODRAFT_140529 [Calocera cornea HHB12733]|uniref:Uncharacterized protein n=1 Tax=Calocera cornea HHB12733 TaxID=1353952 RepID=A0A165K4V9_9BASI|nr:hypothetical protein CALCODRAFT_140529 [Calocera cornea HHB12733]